MKFFLPKQSDFFNSFRELSGCFTEITDLFYDFSQEFSDFEQFASKAKGIEKKADSIAHKIIDGLNRTFITPIDREDIYLLAHEFDDLIDLIESVMHDIYVYEITQKFSAAVEFGVLFKECAVCLDGLLQCLQKPKYTAEVMNFKIKIHEMEDQGDAVYTESMRKLFKESTDPIATIKMKYILENLENTLDKCQRVSDIIEGIIIKSV